MCGNCKDCSKKCGFFAKIFGCKCANDAIVTAEKKEEIVKEEKTELLNKTEETSM